MSAQLGIYMASRYSRKEEMREKAKLLEDAGYAVTSSWLKELDSPDSQLQDLTPEQALKYAEQDLLDIKASDIFLFFAEDPKVGTPRGGRHVEFGFAMGVAPLMVVIGGPENIFHYLPAIQHYPTFEAFMEKIRG